MWFQCPLLSTARTCADAQIAQGFMFSFLLVVYIACGQELGAETFIMGSVVGSLYFFGGLVVTSTNYTGTYRPMYSKEETIKFLDFSHK